MAVKYVSFFLIEKKPKTDVYKIVNNKTEERVGIIKWFPQWRQYCLFPSDQTAWNKNCLGEVNTFINKLMEDRKKR